MEQCEFDSLSPGQVRARILADHVTLRGVLDDIDALAKCFRAGDPGVGAQLRDTGAEFFELFASHLKLEDALLLPAIQNLREGDFLADRLEREHREQRELIHFLLARLNQDDRPTNLVASELASFSDYVRKDMTHEEETILREGLLSDD